MQNATMPTDTKEAQTIDAIISVMKAHLTNPLIEMSTDGGFSGEDHKGIDYLCEPYESYAGAAVKVEVAYTTEAGEFVEMDFSTCLENWTCEGGWLELEFLDFMKEAETKAHNFYSYTGPVENSSIAGLIK